MSSDKVALQNSSNEKTTKTLIKKGSVLFPLDSLTPPQSRTVQFKNNYFCLLNMANNSIHFFDYKNKKETNRITFPFEGDDGVSAIYSFYFHNEDSIFIYNGSHVILSNMQGEIQKRIKIAGETTAWIIAETRAPLTYDNGKLYGVAPRLGEETKTYPHTISINIEKGDITELDINTIPLNKKDGNGIWGTLYDMVYYLYLPSKKKWVYSFENNNYIYVTNFKNNANYKAKSKKFDTIPPPFKTKMDLEYIETLKKEYPTNAYYQYNSFGHLVANDSHLFRYVYHKSEAPEKSRGVSIVILDIEENFKRIGEFFLENAEDYYLYMSFATPEGLHIARRDPENEDVLTFDVFQVEELKQ
jgi:hypothetical protein